MHIKTILYLSLLTLTTACIPHKAKHGYTCLCTTQACDSIAPLNWTPQIKGAVVYQTAKEIGDEVGDRLRRFELPFTTTTTTTTTEKSNSKSTPPSRTITFDTSITYQTIRGFGNALTDAAAINYARFDNSSLFLEQYWGKTGLGLSIGRIPIASCDFSTSSWSYDDVNNDYSLEHFSIEHDEKYKIPMIKDVRNAAMQTGQPISLFASPWAPPYWMTNQNSTVGNPTLKNGPTSATAQIYADYLVEFFRRYDNDHGIDFWALTAQNEPAGNTGAWQDLKFTPEEQRDFIKTILGRKLMEKRDTGFCSFCIIRFLFILLLLRYATCIQNQLV